MSTQNQQTISVASQRNSSPYKPYLPCMNLVEGRREDYLKYAVPLYKASIKCDWKAAKVILDMKPEIVRYSITGNGETPLHVAASAKVSKKQVDFVKNLLVLMTEPDDLIFQNKNNNTAFYLAATAGNLEVIKMMLNKNGSLLEYPGGETEEGQPPEMMPLYTAALFGKHEVVKYMYEKSKDLTDDGWTPRTRSWLLETCIENNMFDIALKIVKKPQNLKPGGEKNLLGILARMPDAFSIKKRNFISRFFIWVFVCVGLLKGAQQHETEGLQLLKIIWEDTVKKPADKINSILRGPPDLIKQDSKLESVRVGQALQLESLVSEHVSKLRDETNIIMGSQTNLTTQEKKDQASRLQQLIFKHLLDMQVKTQNIVGDTKPISGKEDQVMELQNLITKHIVRMHVKTHEIIRGKNPFAKEIQAPHLHKLISELVNNFEDETHEIVKMRHAVTIQPKHSSRTLFVAAEMGNTKFLVELISQYPDLIWKVDDNNQTIFHIAVKHRREGIYNLLFEIGVMKDFITPITDLDDNNMLHLVGKIAGKKQLQGVSGVALQMQRELLWFKEMENMIPPSYREKRNKDGLTPQELFTKEHKDLVTLGEKWMKGTANQCMVVAALIATIVFAAAFTVPGGYNQNNGIPIFHSKATFMVFVVADAISLFSSSASILIFLSILTSRYAEHDFLKSLPEKLMYGLLSLFLSITTMTVAFSVSFFVLYYKGLLWIPILIAVFAVMPVFLYILLQAGLFVDVFRSIYLSKHLFKPQRHVLYYENPKV